MDYWTQASIGKVKQLQGDDTGLKDLRIMGNASLYQVFKLFKPAAAGQ